MKLACQTPSPPASSKYNFLGCVLRVRLRWCRSCGRVRVRVTKLKPFSLFIQIVGQCRGLTRLAASSSKQATSTKAPGKLNFPSGSVAPHEGLGSLNDHIRGLPSTRITHFPPASGHCSPGWATFSPGTTPAGSRPKQSETVCGRSGAGASGFPWPHPQKRSTRGGGGGGGHQRAGRTHGIFPLTGSSCP